MKKMHDIDELFKVKLQEHQINPQRKSKEAFLSKVQPVRKNKTLPLWYFATAMAAIFIAATTFWVVKEDKQSQSVGRNEIVKVTQPKLQEAQEIKQDQMEMLKSDSKNEPQENNFKSQNRTLNNTSIRRNPPQIAQKINKPAPKVQSAITRTADTPAVPNERIQVIDEAIPDELTLAALNAEKEKKQPKKKLQEGLFQKDIGETVIIIAKESTTEPTIYLPEADQDSEMTIANATQLASQKKAEERSLIAQVFSGLKSLKRGEKVDLNTLASNIEEKDGFISHEVVELRERLKWIKSKVSSK